MPEKKRSLKQVAIITLIVLVALTMTSCASMLAGVFGLEVDPPVSQDSSLLFVELIAFTGDEEGTRSDSLIEVNYRRGFYPIVVDQAGNEVFFNHIEGLTSAGLIYHSANIPAGTYTLKGFRYLWMTHHNFMNSPIKDLKFDGQRSDEFIEIQELALPEPVQITIKPGAVASLGSYKLYYELQEYAYIKNDDLQRKDDEYRMNMFRYEDIKPNDTHLLVMMQDWTYKPWKLWNERNPLAK